MFRRKYKESSKIGPRVEQLESRQLLTTTLFEDSFEVSTWNGKWVEDSQNDWFRSGQRATDGSVSAEVDGYANNATLTMVTPVDLNGSAILGESFSAAFDVTNSAKILSEIKIPISQ